MKTNSSFQWIGGFLVKKRKKKHQQKQKHNHQNGHSGHRDVETATELSPEIRTVKTPRAKWEDVGGTGLGITALTLSILGFFKWPLLLALLGIVFGVVGGRRGSKAGWWAVGIGAFVLLIRILAVPLLAIF